MLQFFVYSVTSNHLPKPITLTDRELMDYFMKNMLSGNLAFPYPKSIFFAKDVLYFISESIRILYRISQLYEIIIIIHSYNNFVILLAAKHLFL